MISARRPNHRPRPAGWLVGAKLGAFVGLCLLGANAAVNHPFEQRSWKSWVINAVHEVAVCVVTGAVLGIWRLSRARSFKRRGASSPGCLEPHNQRLPCAARGRPRSCRGCLPNGRAGALARPFEVAGPPGPFAPPKGPSNNPGRDEGLSLCTRGKHLIRSAPSFE